jgi:phosphoribosyl-AMP cyclohydrolase / phosphoribosyl-ATP pyrophosphohydrolase
MMPKDIVPPFNLESVTFDAAGLVPIITQEAGSKDVLMLAYANREALEKTLTTGLAHYFSRSRNKLWQKGEESGHTQKIHSIRLDCDGDAVLYTVDQSGPACHKLEHSCFHNSLLETEQKPETRIGPANEDTRIGPANEDTRIGPANEDTRIGPELEYVFATIQDRIRNPTEGSYVAKMHNAGIDRILKKIGEEAGEVIIAAKNADRAELQLEVADLFFHTLFTMAEIGVSLEDVARELEGRHGKRRT